MLKLYFSTRTQLGPTCKNTKVGNMRKLNYTPPEIGAEKKWENGTF